MQTTIRCRCLWSAGFAQQLFVQVSYTWSKALGISNVDGDFVRIDSFTHAANYARYRVIAG